MTKRRVAYIRDKVDGRNNIDTKRRKHKTGNTRKKASGQTAAVTAPATDETLSKSHILIASPAEVAAAAMAATSAGEPLPFIEQAEEQLPLESSSAVVRLADEQEEEDDDEYLSISPEIVDSLFVPSDSNGKTRAAVSVADSDESEATDDDLVIITTVPAMDQISSSSSSSLTTTTTSSPLSSSFGVDKAVGGGEDIVGGGIGGLDSVAGGREDGGRGVGESAEGVGGGGEVEARLLEIRSMKVWWRTNMSCSLYTVNHRRQ